MKKIFTYSTLFLAFYLFLFQSSFASQKRKVLWIGIDGCRADVLIQANTPNIDAVLPNSLYSLYTYNAGITVSGQCWSTMLTGVYWNKHGVIENSFTGRKFDKYPLFIKHAKEINPNLKCVEVSEWSALINKFGGTGWDKMISAKDGAVTPARDSVIEQLQDPDLDVLFVHFDNVDLAGHSTGFSPQNPRYVKAIEDADAAVGKILEALHNRPTYSDEDWLIFISTDHGGQGLMHGGNSILERRLWWIASGDAVEHKEVNGEDPGTYHCKMNFQFEESCVDTSLLVKIPTHPDIAVTALHHLIYDSGINPKDVVAWDLDGKSWLKQQIPTGIKEELSSSIDIYPNPNQGKFTIANHGKEKLKMVDVFDLSGKKVKSFSAGNSNLLQINISDLSKGSYFLVIENENLQQIKKMISLQ
ncbi:MAG: alkaline phosphatase family protein [Chitinophagales bacterium]|nr:alkaline phosphatase family protein [Chitinophagales bacterium]